MKRRVICVVWLNEDGSTDVHYLPSELPTALDTLARAALGLDVEAVSPVFEPIVISGGEG